MQPTDQEVPSSGDSSSRRRRRLSQGPLRQEVVDVQAAPPAGMAYLVERVSHQVWTLAATVIAAAVPRWPCPSDPISRFPTLNASGARMVAPRSRIDICCYMRWRRI